ncbi:response regulator [Pseudonocardia halophobica]|uniref:Response regulator n=1 Tax=Pseudonocardia halophobica TaxID=29401 RepID=A0A9W6L6P3_9PSEU|nr:response regulator [Pseudonocardia halophobica]GLL12069.1 response regulator [Pseudonocardia halophobica]
MLADITGLIGVLIWPALVLVVVVLFRKPLTNLLSGSLTVKGPGGLEISASSRQQAATALTQATVAKGAPPMDQKAALDRVDDAARTLQDVGGRARLLWVDDHPSGNRHEATALEAVGIDVELSPSTEDALERTQRNRYDVIVSDMERLQHPQAGYDLLQKLRSSGVHTPFIVYAPTGRPERFDEAVQHGADGWADTPEQLMQMVLAAVRRERS